MCKKLFLFFVYLVLFVLETKANNAFYITVSNQVARKQDLEIIANNAANSNTIGYEEDGVIFNNYDVMQSRRKNNSFVTTKGIYKPGDQGALKYTNNPMDVAIIGKDQYFKISSPNGIRYSLAGSLFRSSGGVIVNSDGYPFLSINNDVIQVPIEAIQILVSEDGMIVADGQEIERLGVSYFPNKTGLSKEGDSLYKSSIPEEVLDEYTIVSGALRASNVNPSRILSKTLETERSFSITSNLLHEIGDVEKQAVTKMLKQ